MLTSAKLRGPWYQKVHSLMKLHVNVYLQSRSWDKLLPENGWVPKIGRAHIGTLNLENHEIKTHKDSKQYIFKATEVERKLREVNLLIDIQINPSWSTSDCLSIDCHGTR